MLMSHLLSDYLVLYLKFNVSCWILITYLKKKNILIGHFVFVSDFFHEPNLIYFFKHYTNKLPKKYIYKKLKSLLR